MAIVEMSKITLYAHKSDRGQIIRRLQEAENVEISPPADDDILCEDTAGELNIIERQISITENALSIIKPFSKKKSSLFSGKSEVLKDAYGNAKKDREKTLKIIYSIINKKKQIDDITALNARLYAQIASLEPWQNFDMPLDFSGTKNTAAFIGSLPSSVNLDDCREKISQKYESVYIKEVSHGTDLCAVAVFCMKSEKFDVEAYLRGFGFSKPPFELLPHSAKHEIAALEKQISVNKSEIENIKKELEFSSDSEEELELLYDYFLSARERRIARSKIGETQQTFVIYGYTPSSSANALKKSLEDDFCCSVCISELSEDEEMPIKFKNNAYVEPVEPVTEMFSYPSRTDVDPNPIMSVFYYIFFGLMLSDAGYGLILFFGGLYITKKFKPEGTLGKMVRMFTFCGIGATFWGALFGSWFGDIVQQTGRVFFGVQIGELGIYNPITDPMPLLIISFVLGGIHLFTAMGVNFYNLCRHGKVWDAIFDVGFWYLFLIGLIMIIPVAPLGSGIVAEIGKYTAIAGALGLLLTQGRSKSNIFGRITGGLASIYSVTSYLSDVLSYSRLLALGLATGVISNVVNTMAVMGGKSIIGVIMLVLVFVFGHVLNLLINVLGAYVHTNRLHYVEFFQKFYEGGGKKFSPFSFNTKYTKIQKS